MWKIVKNMYEQLNIYDNVLQVWTRLDVYLLCQSHPQNT